MQPDAGPKSVPLTSGDPLRPFRSGDGSDVVTLVVAAGHAQADRVVALLQAAPATTGSGCWAPTIGQSLGFALVVFAPVEPPSDATNYLGGVADVLEAKSHHGALTHLGDLTSVWLYDNARRIHEVL